MKNLISGYSSEFLRRTCHATGKHEDPLNCRRMLCGGIWEVSWNHFLVLIWVQRELCNAAMVAYDWILSLLLTYVSHIPTIAVWFMYLIWTTFEARVVTNIVTSEFLVRKNNFSLEYNSEIDRKSKVVSVCCFLHFVIFVGNKESELI